jgi:hypothetical protein
VRISATSPSSSAAKLVTATCPSGKKLLGMGAEMTTSAGQVVIDGIKPSATLESVTVNAFEDGTGTTYAWSITAYAICAAVPGLELRGTTTDAGSPASDVLDSECNPGTTLVGMGGEINGGGGQVVIDALYRHRPGASGFAAFEDDTGFSGSWSLTAYAICAPYAARLSETAPADDVVVDLDVDCPQDTQITGVGGELTGAMGEAYLNILDPGSGGALNAVAWARTARAWSMTAHAVCAATPAGYEVVSGVVAGQQTTEVIVTCPAGKRVLGGGARAADLGRNGSLQAIAPSIDLTSVRIAVSEDELGAENLWSLTGMAMCATPPPGLQLVSRTTASNSDEDHKQVAATCPAGKHVIGSGAAVLPATGHVIIDDLRPSPGLTSVQVTGMEDRTGYAGPWAVRAYAVCVNR